MSYKLTYMKIPYLVEEKGEELIFFAYYKNRDATVNLRLKTCSCVLGQLSGNCHHIKICKELDLSGEYLGLETLELDEE